MLEPSYTHRSGPFKAILKTEPHDFVQLPKAKHEGTETVYKGTSRQFPDVASSTGNPIPVRHSEPPGWGISLTSNFQANAPLS